MTISEEEEMNIYVFCLPTIVTNISICGNQMKKKNIILEAWAVCMMIWWGKPKWQAWWLWNKRQCVNVDREVTLYGQNHIVWLLMAWHVWWNELCILSLLQVTWAMWWRGRGQQWRNSNQYGIISEPSSPIFYHVIFSVYYCMSSSSKRNLKLLIMSWWHVMITILWH